MSDIDWAKEPKATHYSDSGDHYPWERRHGDAHSYVGHDGEWHELSKLGRFEWPGATPRPAQHRDWSDPAMWFDAPENFDQVRVDVETGVLFYCGFVCGGLALCHTLIPGQQSDVYGIKASELVACRPSQKQTIESIDAMGDLNCPKCKNTMTPCYNGEGFLRIWWCQICDHTDKAIGRERLIKINKT